jgi:hypothetical protein
MTESITDSPVDPRLPSVAHPGYLLERLMARIQAQSIRRFTDIQDDWLRLMWSIDTYRVNKLCPPGMGKPELTEAKRLEGVYRSKGNWFKDVLSVILQNLTDQPVRPRVQVEGFSQHHQIDLAWPAREVGPLVCVEAKVTGAPAYGDTPARSALADFSNRRKELKFAATDLKLYRRQIGTEIRHWGHWKDTEPPTTYFVWAARLKTEGRNRDAMARLILEAQALVKTYLNGAGLFAWQENVDRTAYEAVPLPPAEQVTTLDDVLYRIASDIQRQAPDGRAPPPVVPTQRAVDIGRISDERAPYEV